MNPCSFSLPVSLLSAAVDFAGSAVEQRHALPILTHLLFRADDKRLSVIGSDLEIEMEYRMDLQEVTLGKDVSPTDICMTLPAKKMKDLLKTAPNDAIATLTRVTDSQYAMTFSGLRSRYTLQTLSPNDFPSIDSTTAGAKIITMEAPTFLRSFLTVTHAMANQDVRYYLNGMHFTAEDDTLIMTATDGHRLSQNRVMFSGKKTDTTFSAILPRAAALVLPSMLKGATGELTVAVTDNHILAKVSNDTVERVMKSKQIDGRFPDWKRVIPKTSQQVVTFQRLDFMASLKRAAILSNEKYRGVSLDFKGGTLTVESRNSENEQAKEELAVTGNTEDVMLGANVDYLLTALSNYSDDTVLLHLGSSTTSMLLTPTVENGMLDVIMPMRI